MKNFPLAGLLRLRHVQQDEAAGALATANREARSVRVRRTNTIGALATTSDSPMTPEALMAIAAARSSSRSMLTELEALTSTADHLLSTAQQAFNQARTASVSLEKMQDKHDTHETALELDVEQKALDEISVNTFSRRQP